MAARAATGRVVAEFADVVLGQRDGVPRKPHPAGAIEIAQRMNLPPAEFLYLGDTAIDMQTAVQAGMQPVGALWGFRSREELLQHGAATLVERPEEVWELAEKLGGGSG